VYVKDGFCTVLVFPSPNDQSHEVGVPVDESVNCTVNGTVPDVGVALKPATGAAEVVVMVCVYEVEPMELVAVRVTV
jgi:hypothetical protein